ncbi:hypothetical protein [Costertonia aggregata]|uniref:Uncharacterized protein n=1 Tax=Costertonia aggregata TaxID=343403 RepID=A0A7H9ATK9_9FLAO|nr:hypothetical protein [Costertonia aggregata]QLG46794.1 hypothetical protein HYG79_16030 [Costertonia aggregata]
MEKPQNIHADAAGICVYGENDMVALSVQSTANGGYNPYRSQIYCSNEFELSDDAGVLDNHKRIYAIVVD